jgi:alkylhydroperoxidase family enzyme
LSTKQILLCEFAEKLTLTPGQISKLDFKKLKKAEFSDKEISEAVQVTSYFNYINRVADGLGLEPEEFIDEKGYKK